MKFGIGMDLAKIHFWKLIVTSAGGVSMLRVM